MESGINTPLVSGGGRVTSWTRDRKVAVVVGCLSPLVHGGLTGVLYEDHGIDVVAAELDEAALERAVAERSPRVAIVGEQVDHSVLERFGLRKPSTASVVIVNEATPLYVSLLLAAGATCVSHEAPPADVLAAIHMTARGKCVFVKADGDWAESGLPAKVDLLTPKEIEVFGYLTKGRSQGEIAFALDVGIETVRTHASSIRRKLGVPSSRGLIGMPVPRVRRMRSG